MHRLAPQQNMAIITLERARPSNDNEQKSMMTTMMTMFLLMTTKAKLNEQQSDDDEASAETALPSQLIHLSMKD